MSSHQTANATPAPYSELITILDQLPFLLQEMRRRKGLSLRKVAELTGIPHMTVKRFEQQGVPAAVLTLLKFVGSDRTPGT